MRRFFFAIFLLAASFGFGEPVRLLVVTGSHPFDASFNSLFEGHEDIRAEFRSQAPEPCSVYTEDFAEGFDVVLLYDFEFKITGEQKANFEKAFGSGRGLIVLHHAMCSHPDWPAFREIAGGQFFFDPPEGMPKSEYEAGVAYRIEIAEPDHPITRGLKPFDVVDETYRKYWIKPGSTPLLRTTSPKSESVLAWTSEHDESRVVTIQPGHGPEIFQHPEYRKFIARSILWAAGRE